MTALRPSERLAAAYARAAGWPAALDVAVHPDDDMLRFLGDSGVERERALALYLHCGDEAARALEHACTGTGRALRERTRVLEFAAGFGRVTRFLTHRAAPGALVSSDVLAAALPFLSQRFGVATVPSAADPRHLALGGPYDAMLVASLFSHLSEPRFEAFLAALADRLAPGGVLVLSTHGAAVAPDGTRTGDFTFVARSESHVLSGEEYGTSYVAPERVAEIARRVGLTAARVFERGLWELQDLWVLGRDELSTAIAALRPPPRASGSLEPLERRPGFARAFGWVRSAEALGPVRRVALAVGDERAEPFEAQLGPPVWLAATSPLASGRWHREWLLEGPVPPGAPAGAPVVALAALDGGPLAPFDVRALPAD